MKTHKLTGGREIELVERMVGSQQRLLQQLQEHERELLRMQALGAQEFAKLITELKQEMRLAADAVITSIDFQHLKTRGEATVYEGHLHGEGCTCGIDSPEVGAMLEKIITGAKVN